ncbi:hypothetical protein PC113_g20891 [Phytophthora cactorum]|uniref:Uncharacterized protein n=1 Tax=Phytophthora cactorum TaxID=29920 RepID=A0A8T0YAA0_9STRA|nr:hypothetical protein PC113_g20891 [Phytophthora cactorum]
MMLQCISDDEEDIPRTECIWWQIQRGCKRQKSVDGETWETTPRIGMDV